MTVIDGAGGGGWRAPAMGVSLAELHGSIALPRQGGVWRKALAFAGPGFVVSVGYMDPGNWATDLAGGSAFGYTLLSVVLLSNLMAMLLQALSARLGIATGRDLAQACRDSYPAPVTTMLWVLCEVAICACDLAEVIGTAIGLKLLFGLPILLGVCLTALDVFVILLLQRHGFRHLEAFVISLIALVAAGFLFEIALAHPAIADVAAGLLPRAEIITDPSMLYIAIGILGATVMPHNLYLHSSIVQTRRFAKTPQGRREALRFAVADSNFALATAFFINAAILIIAAAAFHQNGRTDVAEIQDAHHLLGPLLGAPAAGIVFALALLAAGQNSLVTATLAGQVVMEGFLDLRMPVWLRRLITRAIAIVPAIVVTAMSGEKGLAHLLILSQVILSLQLPFAVIPLVAITRSRAKMGALASPAWLTGLAAFVAAVILAANVKMLLDLI
ncbi:MAG TPA: Nramp family divalent metal transporter [Dongiaceae bacterium]|nr:Nramp family divalent metal transporter [Dongiaceae bacterium]